MSSEFSFKTRAEALERFKNEVFDLLIIGGGITGAATARDAVSRGLKVALVERCDFAWGTSSRSSKLIHGGLRYLENFEFSLIFESLSERAHLLKTAPHLVRPLPFYLPVYEHASHGKATLSLGLWLYDLLALFRTPGFHKNLSKEKILKLIPFLKPEGLEGALSYYDANMWDDVLVVDTVRHAQMKGAVVANYVEGIYPLWEKNRIVGFKVRDVDTDRHIDLYAKQVIVCVGPWTDEMGFKLDKNWKPWISPSKGIHLVFDLKRIPVPGAVVMNNPADGRVSFVIPRPDFGSGVAIVGTTDGPTSVDPDKAKVMAEDVSYLMGLLNRYFPALNLQTSDIISTYVGVRPLMGGEKQSQSLQKISREHFIGEGPGGTIIVTGGKYTTHRSMAKEIVDETLKTRKEEWEKREIGKSNTSAPVNPEVMEEAVSRSLEEAKRKSITLPQKLVDRFGA